MSGTLASQIGGLAKIKKPAIKSRDPALRKQEEALRKK